MVQSVRDKTNGLPAPDQTVPAIWGSSRLAIIGAKAGTGAPHAADGECGTIAGSGPKSLPALFTPPAIARTTAPLGRGTHRCVPQGAPFLPR